MQGTAYEDPPWLICYDDEHYIQSTALLYHVLFYADGHTPLTEIAELVSMSTGTGLTADDVRWLVEQRLVPSGLLDVPGGSDRSSDEDASSGDEQVQAHGRRLVDTMNDVPLLGIRFRVPFLPYRVSSPITGLLKYLYATPIMVALIIIAVGVNVSVFMNAELQQAMRSVVFEPKVILALVGLDLLSVLFHEFGHAAALKRAGCKYGVIGFALYIIWPVFYTDVTHVYRLNRPQRLRVDLGGLYFQLIAMIVLYLAFLATSSAVYLIAIVLTGASFLQQFTPFLRFDGYYTIADTIGVNEPLSLIRPFIRDYLPWRKREPKVLGSLRWWAKLAFVSYLLCVALFFIYPAAFAFVFGSDFIHGLIDSGRFYWNSLVNAVHDGDALTILTAGLTAFLWLLVPLGLLLFVGRLAKQLVQALFALGRRVVRGRRTSIEPDPVV